MAGDRFAGQRPIIAVAGALAHKPHHGGHAWVLLHYLLGFRRLGWDILFIDRIDPHCSVDAAGRPCAPDASINAAYVSELLSRFDLGDSFVVLAEGGRVIAGLSRDEAIDRLRRSAALLNIMGFLREPEWLAAAPGRVFIDIDPGFPQMWCDLGLADLFADHDAFVTVGSNIGRGGCTVPTCGRDWITMRPPVVLDCWPEWPAVEDAPFTTVASWRGGYGPVDYKGQTYGLRVHEFRRFLDLPSRTGARFELALDIDPSDAADVERLRDAGWILRPPREVAGTAEAYRACVRASAAEFTPAKNMYVRSQGGWFSDRSVCYLASGRPVVAQRTAPTPACPEGEGLLLFDTIDEATASVNEVRRDYARHSRAARRLAETYFDSDIVLGALVRDLGLES